ncbi:MAG: hypothetical protein IPM91_08625 [Bacteroidetes bacterium]|nr:hypothetical protein [Bacteroidota bacterium]
MNDLWRFDPITMTWQV